MARLPIATRHVDLADVALAALSGANPAAARQARRALDVILAPLRASVWPEVAWGFSTLTASGCPLEVSFNTAEPCIRYTAEVAGPEYDHSARLSLTLAVMSELVGGQDVPVDLIDDLGRLQGVGTLHWGAWVGGRHDGQRSRFKLYAEVPRDVPSRDFAVRWFPAIDRVGHRYPQLEGVGHETGTGLTELYFRLDGLDVADIGAMLDSAGFGARQGDLLALMSSVYGRPMHPHLPQHPFGVSVACLPGPGIVALSVFGYAIDVFGDDAASRRALLTVAPRLGWDDAGYRELTAALADTHSAPTRHSVIAFTVTRGDAPAALTVGLAPPC